MRKIAILMMLAACGGEMTDGEEIGQLEQGYTAAEGIGFRVDLSGSQTRCVVPGLASQICLVPPDKTITTRITSDGISASEKTALEGTVTTVYANWETQLNDPTWDLALTTSNGDVNVRYGTLTGGAITSIHRFARVTIFNSGAAMTEDEGPGVWKKYSGSLTCTIDKAAIDANFNTQAKRDRVRSHALYYCMLKPMGIGSTSAAVTKAYTIATTPDNAKDITLGDKVKCLIQTLDSTSGTSLTLHSDCNDDTDN